MSDKLRHHGAERLVEILYPSEKQGTQRLLERIERRRKPEIKQQRTKARERMEEILRRRNRNPRGGCETPASRRRRSGMSTMRRTFRTDRGARLV